MNFFQNYAKGRKVSNTIWNLPTQDSGIANTFSDLSRLGNSHFQHLYKEPSAVNLAEIIRLEGHFSSFVDLDTA